MVVETANTAARATGVGTARLPGLGQVVKGLVMDRAPSLLSAGQLAQHGYRMSWHWG